MVVEEETKTGLTTRDPESEGQTARRVEDEEEKSDGEDTNSLWVLQNIQRINKIVEVTFEGLNDRMMEIFVEIEKRRKEKKGGTLMAKGRRRQGDGRPRKLKRLQLSINYDCRKKSYKNVGVLRKISNVWENNCFEHVGD